MHALDMSVFVMYSCVYTYVHVHVSARAGGREDLQTAIYRRVIRTCSDVPIRSTMRRMMMMMMRMTMINHDRDHVHHRT